MQADKRDCTDQNLVKLTSEVSQLATDFLVLAQRLNELNINLVSNSDVQSAKQRTVRLRGLLKSLKGQSPQS